MQPILDWRDDHSPGLLHIGKLGMVKEFHGEDEPMSWTEYEMKTGYRWRTPKTGIQNGLKVEFFRAGVCFQAENKDRKYPAVVVLHGGFNPISIIDGWGFPRKRQDASGF